MAPGHGGGARDSARRVAGNVGASAAPLAPAPYGTESGGSVIVVLADQHANLNGVVATTRWRRRGWRPWCTEWCGRPGDRSSSGDGRQSGYFACRFSRNAAMPSRAAGVWDAAAITSTAIA